MKMFSFEKENQKTFILSFGIPKAALSSENRESLFASFSSEKEESSF